MTTIFPSRGVLQSRIYVLSRERESSLSSARFRILNIYAFSSSPAHFPHRFSARFSSFARSLARSFDGLRNEPNGGSLLPRLPLTAAAVLHFPDCVRAQTYGWAAFVLPCAFGIISERAAVKLSVCPTNQSEGVWYCGCKMPIITEEEEERFIDEEQLRQ